MAELQIRSFADHEQTYLDYRQTVALADLKQRSIESARAILKKFPEAYEIALQKNYCDSAIGRAIIEVSKGTM
jgi:hypothetical protein